MLLFFDLGTGEILLILLVLFIVVGPRQLPEVARTVGKAINEMKRASAGFRNEIQKEAARLEREAGIAELKKPLNDMKIADIGVQAQQEEKPDEAPNQLDEIGAIPFGSDSASNDNQNEKDSNKI